MARPLENTELFKKPPAATCSSLLPLKSPHRMRICANTKLVLLHAAASLQVQLNIVDYSAGESTGMCVGGLRGCLWQRGPARGE